MAHAGKNKGPRATNDRGEQDWFRAKRERNRRRDKAAKLARRRNRG